MHLNQESKFIITFVCRCADFINCDKIRFNIVNNYAFITVKIDGYIRTIRLIKSDSEETKFFRKILKLTEFKELPTFLDYCKSVYIRYFGALSYNIIDNIDNIAERTM